jgi:uncharacterized membrane protein
MRKERLELFSDGVFAIILTLLVLDLKVPVGLGITGLKAAMPGLLVHAGAFFVIGMAWVTHHQFFEHIERITTRLLGWNLLVLFWITLVPYGARIAADHPSDGLGVAIMCLGVTLSMASIQFMIAGGGFESAVFDPALVPLRKRRARMFMGYVVLGLFVTVGCFIWPIVGYLFLTIGASALVVRPMSEMHAKMTAK